MEGSPSFGTWLTQRRKALDLTREALARRLGYAVGTLRKWESNERRPSKASAERLAHFLEVPVVYRATFVRVARAEIALDRLALAPAAVENRRAVRGGLPLASGVTAPDVRTRARLPSPPTSLIGRAHEVAAVQIRLSGGDVRLLTLIGPPGIGKTRVSLQAAAELANEFHDGVAFVRLAPLADPGLVLPTIAQALGIPETPGQPLLASLTSALGDKHLLLVLDNFEHVLTAAPLVGELIEGAPRLRVLATSRRPLHLYWEHEYAVPPLDVPNIQHLRAPEQLATYTAVRLFVARAQAVQGGFRLTPENASVVASICARLEGLPLAIELAAARIKIIGLEALLARLQSRLGELTAGARNLPPRQQTLRSAIAWSYQLLAPEEQTLFARLGVFAGGWTAQAAAAVCSGTSGTALDVMAGLETLLDQSLLQCETEGDGASRFTMLETIREYALEQLHACAELVALQEAHADFFLALAEGAVREMFAPEVDGPRRPALWGRRLQMEHDNLRAVLRWAIDTQHVECALRLALALKPFWYLRGHFSEGRAWLDMILAMSDDPAASGDRGVLRVKVLREAADLAGSQGDAKRRGALLEQSLALARWIGDVSGMACALHGLARDAQAQGDAVTAHAQLEESLELFQAAGTIWGTILALSGLAALATEQGNHRQAGALLDRSLALARQAGTTWQLAEALWGAGNVARDQRDYRHAQRFLEESMGLFRAVGDTWATGCTLNTLGTLAHLQGDYERGAALLKESLTLFRELEHLSGISACFAGLVEIMHALGHADRAARLAGAAEALFEAVGVHLDGAHLTRADRMTYERDRASLASGLGDQVFAAAWATGRAMPLEQAVAYALEETATVP